MVEIGVQSIYPKVLDSIKRMHTIEDVKSATRIAKDAGLKVNYHMMVGLPGTGMEDDVEQFRRLFDDPDLKPDALKIYPTLVVKGTEIYGMWKRGVPRLRLPMITGQGLFILMLFWLPCLKIILAICTNSC